MTFTVTLSEAPTGSDRVTVDYAPSSEPGDTATIVTDYARSGSTLTFFSGQTEKTINVSTTGDSVDEEDETFTVTLSNPSPGVTITTATAKGTITDNDDPPSLRISNQREDEGGTIKFGVTLSPISGKTVTVAYATGDAGDSAAAGDDYTEATGTLRFAPGDDYQEISVQTLEDTTDEENEEFTVTLSGAVNAAIGAPTATGTITDNDGPPTVSIADGSGSEGGKVTFAVTLSEASGKTVSVRYRTGSGGSNPATAGTDYTAVTTAQTLTFAPGETSKTIEIAAATDTVSDAGETFLVRLSNPSNAILFSGAATGTINEGPVLSISDRTATEGDDITFTVTLSRAGHTGPVTVDYATGATGDTAVAGADYTAKRGRLTFGASDTSKTFTVRTREDTLDEDAESFTVTLSNPTAQVTLSAETVSGTITDDDPTPTVSIADGSGAEGGNVKFTVSLSAASGKEITVRYRTSITGGNTASAADFKAAPATTLTFAPGDTSKTISVAATEDDVDDPDETFIVTLLNPSNATLGDRTATGTINEGANPSILIAVRKSGHERNRHRDGGTFYQRSVQVAMYNLESDATWETGYNYRGDYSTLDYVHRTDFAAGNDIGDIYHRSDCEGPSEFDPNRPGTYFLNDVFREIRQVNENPETRLGSSVDDNLAADSCVNHFTVKVTVWDGTDYEYSGTAAEPVTTLTCTFKGNDDGSDDFRAFSRNEQAYPDYYDDPAFHYQSYLACTDSDRNDQPDSAPAAPPLDWEPPEDPDQAG